MCDQNNKREQDETIPITLFAVWIPFASLLVNGNGRVGIRLGNRDFFKREMEAMRFRPDVQTDAWFESRVDQLMRVSEAHVRDGVQTMHDLDVERQLGGVSIPVLMIAGAVDGLLSHNLADFALFPDATLQVFSHAGHEVAIHEPDGVAAAIDNFMQMGVVTGAKLLDRALSHASADQ